MNIVITGTSSGIGRALAERLLTGGHSVLGLARGDQSGLTSRWPKIFRAARCDVSDWTQIAGAAAEAARAWPHADGLVTCAGWQGEIGRAVAADPARWSATVRANLDGTFHSIRAFHGMLAHSPRRAKIVCFSGGGAAKARPNFSAYGAAKTGVVRLVETIAEEERASALDINAVAPGAIRTRMTEEVLALGPAAVGEAEFAGAVKTGDGPAMERALDLVEWLLSPASDAISGRLISAAWDDWRGLERAKDKLADDAYRLRRVVPEAEKRK